MSDAFERYKKLKYSRDDEHNLPDFKSHEEARAYFKEKHGDNFILTDSDLIDGEKIYFYDLILDREQYEKGYETLENGSISVNGMDFLLSSQKIEIFESGRIHMIH